MLEKKIIFIRSSFQQLHVVLLTPLGFYIALCMSSLLYALSFYPFHIPLLGLLMIPILTLLLGQYMSWRRRFLSYIVLMGTIGIIHLNSFYIAFLRFYDSPLLAFCFTLLMIFIFYGVYVFILVMSFALISSHKKNLLWILQSSLLWFWFDFLKYYFLGGGPYLQSAYLWWFDNNVLQIVSVIGTLGLSLLTYLIVHFMFFAMSAKCAYNTRLVIIFSIVFIIATMYFWGQYRINNVSSNHHETKFLTVRFVQPNFYKGNEYSSLQKIGKLLSWGYEDLDRVSLVIFPEASFSYAPKFESSQLQALTNDLDDNKYLLFGGNLFEDHKVYNGATLVSNHSHQVYKKQRLFKLTERNPFAGLITRFFPAFLLPYSRGDKYTIFNITTQDKVNISFFTTICLESLYPVSNIDISKVDFMINIANESWFDDSILLMKHFEILKYRALELGLPVLKVSNTGVSGLINPLGIIMYQAPKQQLNVSSLSLNLTKIDTIFTQLNVKLVVFIMYFFYTINLVVLLKWYFDCRQKK